MVREGDTNRGSEHCPISERLQTPGSSSPNSLRKLSLFYRFRAFMYETFFLSIPRVAMQTRVQELDQRVGELEGEVEVVNRTTVHFPLDAFLLFLLFTTRGETDPIRGPLLRTVRLEGIGDADVARSVAERGNDGQEGGAAPSSFAFRQLEKRNARLKDALLRCTDTFMYSFQFHALSKRQTDGLTSGSDLQSSRPHYRDPKRSSSVRSTPSRRSSTLGLTCKVRCVPPSAPFVLLPTDVFAPAADLDNMSVELDEAEAKTDDLKAQLEVAREAQNMLEELPDVRYLPVGCSFDRL
jgi:hypothetical protein